MSAARIREKIDAARPALARLGVRSLKLFGSQARDAARPDSDADFLVTFEGSPTFDRYMDVKFLLEDALGCAVDLVVESSLRPTLRQSVERDALRVA